MAQQTEHVIDLRELLAGREKTHGDYGQTALLYCFLKEAIERGPGGRPDRFLAEAVLSLDMILMKISRIMCGDPDCVDHWDDIAGYATLVSNRLRRKQDEEPSQSTEA